MSRQPQFNSFGLTDRLKKNDFIRVAITKFHDRLNELNRMRSDRTDADGQ